MFVIRNKGQQLCRQTACLSWQKTQSVFHSEKPKDETCPHFYNHDLWTTMALPWHIGTQLTVPKEAPKAPFRAVRISISFTATVQPRCTNKIELRVVLCLRGKRGTTSRSVTRNKSIELTDWRRSIDDDRGCCAGRRSLNVIPRINPASGNPPGWQRYLIELVTIRVNTLRLPLCPRECNDYWINLIGLRYRGCAFLSCPVLGSDWLTMARRTEAAARAKGKPRSHRPPAPTQPDWQVKLLFMLPTGIDYAYTIIALRIKLTGKCLKRLLVQSHLGGRTPFP